MRESLKVSGNALFLRETLKRLGEMSEMVVLNPEGVYRIHLLRGTRGVHRGMLGALVVYIRVC